ncbi:FMN-dependent NADH-azoreductase [Pseudoflavitalea sp. G-6-1-2]|uniref:FMN-dependent NADH-azoreductase n=1 Tax=Pseudoflavitalea sp. G-6-1-2 TaxID=2728841 RepID=UPI00146DA12F|nr:NAD(P)H-dependent oxidoreductase [Pseudoflavitalea sp. G-6-1-2]NML20813.1 FMN-dependent NADH-azoreductase [Pseudoflavitalea sp. G-6-1-2]
MKNILHIISSPRQQESSSIKLGNRIIEKLLTQYPGSSVTTHNLSQTHYPPLQEAQIAAFKTPPNALNAEQQQLLSLSNKAVAQLAEADILVIGSPLYNFTIPAGLKAWLDHIVRPGLTFTYENGKPQGLLKVQQVYLALAANGVYSDGPTKHWDFAEPYLRHILGFIGLSNITTFRVEGGGIPGIMETALEKGLESVQL